MTLWLVGGVDPTGGAGLDRGEATVRVVAPGLASRRFVTAWTRQGHGAPATAVAVPTEELAAQLAGAGTPSAIKVGLVPASVAATVARAIAIEAVPVVVDPVLAASDGGTMGVRADALAVVLAAATVITPNRPEAAALTGASPHAPTLVDALVDRFPRAWILLKDGHGTDADTVADVLAHGRSRRVFARARVPGPDPRGTGCALASAIAAELAAGRSVEAACERAIEWLDAARRRTRPGSDGRPHLAG